MFSAYFFIDTKLEKEDQQMIEVGKIAIVNFDKLDKKTRDAINEVFSK